MNKRKKLFSSRQTLNLQDLIDEATNNKASVIEEIYKEDNQKIYSKKVYSNNLWVTQIESSELLSIIYSAKINNITHQKKELMWKTQLSLAENIRMEVKSHFHKLEKGMLILPS